jgi:hypothetical protein
VSDNIIFQIGEISSMKNPSSFYPANLQQKEPMRCIWLPNYQEACILMDKHISTASHFHFFIHRPSLHQGISDLYDCLAAQRPVHLGEAVMLLAICASATQTSMPRDPVSGLFSGGAAEANNQTMAWVKAALDVIDIAEREGHVSLQCLQGMLTVMFVLCLADGISRRQRSIFFRAVTMGRELGLHRIDDSHASDLLDPTRGSKVRAEIGRRTWWYIVCIDW